MSSITDNKIAPGEVTQVFVQRQDDRLHGTPTQNKKVFDEYPDLIRYKHNAALDAIEAKFAENDADIEELKEINVSDAAESARESAEIASESAQTTQDMLGRVISISNKNYTKTWNVTEEQDEFVFTADGYTYNESDTYEVFVNGLKLSESEYTRSEDSVVLGSSISAGNTVEIIVTTNLKGKGIVDTELNEDYTLTISYDDGTSTTTESIRGEKGEKGDTGDAVSDGSLTEVKFSDALKKKAIKEYVIPEMFGAVGDGVHDDTQALQTALDTLKDVRLTGGKTYVISGVTMPPYSSLFGSRATLKSNSTSGAIITLKRDVSITDVTISGKSLNDLTDSGLFFDSSYRVSIGDITIEYCDYAINNSGSVWSINIDKLLMRNCEHGLYLMTGTHTSFNVNNLMFENCGYPVRAKYLNYSNFNVVCGDYANGGDEATWSYGRKFGSSNTAVYYFEGCKGININTLACEHCVGTYMLYVAYSNVSVNHIYAAYFKSYITNATRAIVGTSVDLSILKLGEFVIYGQDGEGCSYTNYVHFPYTYAAAPVDYCLVSMKNGTVTSGTPKQIVDRPSGESIYEGNSKLTSKRLNLTDKSYLVITYTQNPNYDVPIYQRMQFTASNEASLSRAIYGDIMGFIVWSGTLVLTRQLKLYESVPPYGQNISDLSTTTISGNSLKIPLPTGMKTGWLLLESVGERVNYSVTLE